MLLSIKITPDKKLMQASVAVTEGEFGEGLDTHMSDMVETMYAHQGVGLAGVQIGDMRRILVADVGYVKTGEYGVEFIKMVNPEIIETSSEEDSLEEGCLSYPGLEAKVTRPKWVVIRYMTPYGDSLVARFEGYQGRILIHEMDHLDGITIISHLSLLKRKRYQKKLLKGLNNLAERMRRRA